MHHHIICNSTFNGWRKFKLRVSDNHGRDVRRLPTVLFAKCGRPTMVRRPEVVGLTPMLVVGNIHSIGKIGKTSSTAMSKSYA